MLLSTPIQFVKGVGPHLAARLAHLDIRTAADLLWHLPFRYVDRRRIDPIAHVPVGRDRVIVGEVVTAGVTFLGRRRTRIFEMLVADPTGVVSAKWFHFPARGMAARFPKGTRVLLAGELTEFARTKQFVHPETEILETGEDSEVAGRILSIYPSTEGVSQRLLRRIIRTAWDAAHTEFRDDLPPEIRAAHGCTSVREALSTLHFPPADAEVESLNTRRHPAYHTLIFAECFLLEIGLALRRASLQVETGMPISLRAEMSAALRTLLPFSLTPAQERVCTEIAADMARAHPMHRLVQGDVGSGKTVVALHAALQAIAAGYQVAFMAPTEVLAEQHARTIAPWMETLRIPWALVTGSRKGKERQTCYACAATGDLPLLLGTHALLEESVQFARLGLVVIDEQHRFGVAQRLALKKKGLGNRDSGLAPNPQSPSPHVLVMTATPIPRTLAMTLYGDLDISTIDTLPLGRKPVITKIYGERQRSQLYTGMKKELARGRQIYVIYPLVAESEKVDLKNATAMSRVLHDIFAPAWRVALLHGRMSAQEKETIMAGFKQGDIAVLATTSVVEVGVDVPNASVMVVEHAERFGLSQLHQFRGRVGRSTHQSYCVLLAHDAHSPAARARLSIMEETTDGFRIAEEDLKIRGPGEFLGTRQSGLPELRIADLVTDAQEIASAREAAVQLLTEDAALSQPHHASLRRAVMERWGERLALGTVG